MCGYDIIPVILAIARLLFVLFVGTCARSFNDFYVPRWLRKHSNVHAFVSSRKHAGASTWVTGKRRLITGGVLLLPSFSLVQNVLLLR